MLLFLFHNFNLDQYSKRFTCPNAKTKTHQFSHSVQCCSTPLCWIPIMLWLVNLHTPDPALQSTPTAIEKLWLTSHWILKYANEWHRMMSQSYRIKGRSTDFTFKTLIYKNLYNTLKKENKWKSIIVPFKAMRGCTFEMFILLLEWSLLSLLLVQA